MTYIMCIYYHQCIHWLPSILHAMHDMQEFHLEYCVCKNTFEAFYLIHITYIPTSQR